MKIKELRENASLTQSALAEKLGLSVMTIVRYESGEREPRARDLVAMAQIFGCTVDELLGAPHDPDEDEKKKISNEVAEFREAINDLFPEVENKESYADILLDLSDNGKIDKPELITKIKRGIRALENALV